MTDAPLTINEVADHPHPQVAVEPIVDPALAALRAHPSYEAVKAKNAALGILREPSPLELQEHTEACAHDDLTTRQQIAHMLDAVIAEAGNQVKHNAPVTGSIISQLEAIRGLVG